MAHEILRGRQGFALAAKRGLCAGREKSKVLQGSSAAPRAPVQPCLPHKVHRKRCYCMSSLALTLGAGGQLLVGEAGAQEGRDQTSVGDHSGDKLVLLPGGLGQLVGACGSAGDGSRGRGVEGLGTLQKRGM